MEQNKLHCPISGSELVYVGHDEGVFDGNSYYSTIDDPSIIFAVHPFRSNIYAQVEDKNFHSKEQRYFKLLEGNLWQEMKRVPHDNLLFPIDDEGEEWQKACEEANKKHEKRLEKQRYWKEHPEEDPRIFAKTISLDEVQVVPMSLPSTMLFYFESNQDKTHIELLKEMQEAGKIDVEFELEKILGQEFRSATISIVKEKDWEESQKEQILSYKFKGKTVLEWEILASEAKGMAADGNPAWYEPHTNMIDALTMAKLLFLTEEQLKNE
jgi:hypothetical protein